MAALLRYAERMPIDLDADSINRALSAPAKHKQLADLLRAAIEDGRLQPGEEIPGETPLAAMVGISRETVRKALDIIAREGLISRNQGAVTRVTDGPTMPVTTDLPRNEWREAHEVARRRGESLPEVIRAGLRRYIKRHRQ